MNGLVYKYNVSIQSVPAVAHRIGIARSAPFLEKLLFIFYSLRTIDIWGSRGSSMEARRFDRNADQLSQIYHHVSRIEQHKMHQALMLRHRYLQLLEECLKINDALGEMKEKGLI